jgi:hypothetical protein
LATRVRIATVVLAVFCLGISGCTHTSVRKAAGPSLSPSRPASPDVVMLVQYMVNPILNDGVTPSVVAQRAGARSCSAWLDPRLSGAGAYEVHLRVAATSASSATSAVRAFVPTATIMMTGLPELANPPTTMGSAPRQVAC